MSAPQLLIKQEMGQVRQVGAIVFVDGDPYEIMEIKPQVERGVFIDYGSLVEYRYIIATVQRYEERKTA